jgi:hypothetical protein
MLRPRTATDFTALVLLVLGFAFLVDTLGLLRVPCHQGIPKITTGREENVFVSHAPGSFWKRGLTAVTQKPSRFRDIPFAYISG